jgi:hypothetical protein
VSPENAGEQGGQSLTTAGETQPEEPIGTHKAGALEPNTRHRKVPTGHRRHLLSHLESPRALPLLTGIIAISSFITTMTTLFINRSMSDIAERQSVISQRQYYQAGYSTRIGVTTIWKNAYTADTRNRVNRFAVYYTRWDKENHGEAVESVDILADQHRIFDGEVIRKDKNLLQLLDSDLEEKWQMLQGQGIRQPVKGGKWGTLSDGDFVDAALKYRNAVIDCLNALEAIQAIINNRPPGIDKEEPMPDRLEPRYQDLINDLVRELHPFICKYNEANPRPTAPWSNLIDKAPCLPS